MRRKASSSFPTKATIESHAHVSAGDASRRRSSADSGTELKEEQLRGEGAGAGFDPGSALRVWPCRGRPGTENGTTTSVATQWSPNLGTRHLTLAPTPPLLSSSCPCSQRGCWGFCMGEERICNARIAGQRRLRGPVAGDCRGHLWEENPRLPVQPQPVSIICDECMVASMEWPEITDYRVLNEKGTPVQVAIYYCHSLRRAIMNPGGLIF